MPSNMRPSTRAVSLTVSFRPICEPEGPRYVTCAPWSWAATSKPARVRVLSFSKISAISLPFSSSVSVPAYFADLRSAESFSRKPISAGEKSRRLRKWRFFRLYDMCLSLCRVADGGAAHAASAAAPAPKLCARRLQHLDAFGTQRGVGVVVAVVADDQAGPDRQHVVAVVPLLARLLERVLAAGGHHRQRLETHRLGQHVEERPF